MRNVLKLLILFLALPVLGQQTNRFPINRGVLQSDADGANHSWTNISFLQATSGLFSGLSVSNPASAGNGGNTETFSISGNTAIGGFLDYFQSDPSAFSLNVAGGRYIRIPATLNVVGAETMTGGIITSDISETNGAGITTIHGVASTGTVTASNFVTTTSSAGAGQFTGNGGGLSNVPATSIVGTITNISGNAGNLTNILRGYITPFDVGAVGDGSTDDTAALRKWLFIACSSNWIAFLPPAPGGFYKITDVLQVTNGMNAITIQGTGGPIFDGVNLRSTSQIKQFGAGKDGIVITNTASGVKMRDFLITHNTYAYSTRGIAFDGNNGDSDCSFIEGVGIQGFGRGLSLSSVADFQAKGCAFQLNGDGVFVGAGTYTQSGVVENNLLFASCQISYNRTNNIFATAGTITIQSCDIAQVDDGTSQMLSSVGLRVTNSFVTAVSCNFENDIGAGTAQPCIIAGGSSGGGQLTLRGGGSQGQGGANGYTLKATNINVYIDANFNAGAVSADGYGIYEDVSVNGGSLIRSAVLMPFKANLNSTVYDGRTSLFMREWWGGHSALSKTETLWQDHSGWIDSNGVSQGGFDDLNSFLIGARMYGYQGGDNGVKEVDLLQYAKDKVSQMPIYNLYASNAVLIASNSMANVGTRIANMKQGDAIAFSSNGVYYTATKDPSSNLATNSISPLSSVGTYVATSNWFSGTLHGAQIAADAFTNRASAGGKVEYTDANGKLIDATMGSGLTWSGGTLSVTTPGGSGSDTTAWHQSGDNSGTIWGNTNGFDMQMRMQQNGGNGSTVIDVFTIVNNESVSIAMGDTNVFGSSPVNGALLGGEHNSTGNNVTDATIVGGRFNIIGAAGNQSFIGGGGTNTITGAFAVSFGQAMANANNNTIAFNGIPNRVVSTSGNGTDEGIAFFALQNGIVYTNSNYGQVRMPGTSIEIATNLMPVANAPDFNYGVQLFSTNNVVQFQAPTNVDTTKTFFQKCTVFVTNTTAVGKQIIPPANCHISSFPAFGVPFVTNLSKCDFEQYGQKFTNMFCTPVF